MPAQSSGPLMFSDLATTYPFSVLHVVETPVRPVPRKKNIIVDHFSHQELIIQTEWSLSAWIFDEVLCQWKRQKISLFTTSMNKKFLVCVFSHRPFGLE